MARLTRGKAIRAKCLDCCCQNSAEVKRCTVTTCALYPYRMGREIKENELTEEILEEDAEE